LPAPLARLLGRLADLEEVTVDAARLTNALDNLADVAAAIERHADGNDPLDDPDELLLSPRRIPFGWLPPPNPGFSVGPLAGV
jgi:hypothetical protein